MPRSIYILLFSILLFACQKEDKKGNSDDPRLTNKYCNDPRAVNYNWNFPGTPDNSLCFYPSSVFQGTYLFTDTVLNKDYVLADTAHPSYTYMITLIPIGNDYNKMLLQGLHICSDTNDAITLTATRFFKATVDSTAHPVLDSTLLPGQILSHCADTVSGYLTKSNGDDINLRVSLMVYNDTGIVYHVGTAKKQ